MQQRLTAPPPNMSLMADVFCIGSASFGMLCQYINIVRARYKPGTVIVFDGYPDQPSPKDHEHERRRSKHKTSCPEVDCDDTVRVIFSR